MYEFSYTNIIIIYDIENYLAVFSDFNKTLTLKAAKKRQKCTMSNNFRDI